VSINHSDINYIERSYISKDVVERCFKVLMFKFKLINGRLSIYSSNELGLFFLTILEFGRKKMKEVQKFSSTVYSSGTTLFL